MSYSMSTYCTRVVLHNIMADGKCDQTQDLEEGRTGANRIRGKTMAEGGPGDSDEGLSQAGRRVTIGWRLHLCTYISHGDLPASDGLEQAAGIWMRKRLQQRSLPTTFSS
jgi:hypothetical protein